jgi:hypothetical protein
MKDEALKLALEALEESETNNDTMEFWGRKTKSIAAIKQALAAQPAPVQEPVAWRLNGESSLGHGKVFGEWKSGKPPKDVADLASVDKNWSLEFAYTAPPEKGQP